MTGYTAAVDVVGEQVAQHRVADAVALAPGADDRHRAGASSRRTASASARWARASMAASASGVGCRSRWTSMTPSSKVLRTWNPAARNTPTMRWLVGSTVAVKALMPARRAATARYSSRTVAMPRPRWASSTKNATSASDRSGQRS